MQPNPLQNVTSQTRAAVTGGRPSANAKEAVVKSVETFGKSLIKNIATNTSKLADLTTHLVQAGAAEIEVVDVVVVGAGLAGLACAEALLEKSHQLRISVLESDPNRVGGQCLTEKTTIAGRTLDLDLGAACVVPRLHEEVMKLCQRFSVHIVPQFNEGNQIRVAPSGVTSFVKNNPKTGTPFSMNWDLTMRIIPLLDSLSNQVELAHPSFAPNALKWDSQSLYSFVLTRTWTPGVTMNCLNLLTRFLFGCESHQISLLFFLHHVRSNGGVRSALSSIQGENHYLVGGASQLCEKLAVVVRTYENARVETGTRVVEIKARFGNPSAEHPVVVSCANGKRYLTRIVVCSEAAGMMRNIRYVPRLPSEMIQFSQRTFRGVYCKAVLVYDSPWWRTGGFSGFAYNSRPTAENGVCFVLDTSIHSSDGKDALPPASALTAFFLSDAAAGAVDVSPEARRAAVLKSVQRLFGGAERAAKPLSYTEKLWLNEETLTSHLSYPPGQFASYNAQEMFEWPLCFSKDVEARPLIFFAGSSLAQRCNGTLEGALASGRETAKALNAVFSEIAKRRGRNAGAATAAGGSGNEDAAFFEEEDRGVPDDPNAMWQRKRARGAPLPPGVWFASSASGVGGR